MEPRSLILTLSEFLGVVAVLMLAGLSPRLAAVRPIGFLYPRRETIVSLVLYGLMLVFAAALGSQTVNSTGLLPTEGLRSGALGPRLLLTGISLVTVILALILRRQPPKSAGWYSAASAGGLRLGLILAFLTIILSGKAINLMNGITPGEARSLLFVLGIAAAEETIFRGYIQLRLSSMWGNRMGLITTAALYLVWLGVAFPEAGWQPLLMLLTIIRALILGWLAQKSKNTMAPVIYRAISDWMALLA